MRFLFDNALSPIVAARLRDAGHDAVHIRDYGLRTATDSAILDRAKSEDRILVSADTDFGALLAISGENSPSIIIFRRTTNRRPERQAGILLMNLHLIADALEKGALIVVEEVRIRIRELPIR